MMKIQELIEKKQEAKILAEAECDLFVQKTFDKVVDYLYKNPLMTYKIDNVDVVNRLLEFGLTVKQHTVSSQEEKFTWIASVPDNLKV